MYPRLRDSAAGWPDSVATPFFASAVLSLLPLGIILLLPPAVLALISNGVGDRQGICMGLSNSFMYQGRILGLL